MHTGHWSFCLILAVFGIPKPVRMALAFPRIPFSGRKIPNRPFPASFVQHLLFLGGPGLDQGGPGLDRPPPPGRKSVCLTTGLRPDGPGRRGAEVKKIRWW